MASVNDISNSKFLKHQDVGAGALVTVRGVKQENVALDGAEPEFMWAVYFNQFDKALILNKTNAESIAEITGAYDDIEKAWIGAEIVLYTDPNVSFGGKLVGGIRCRKPRLSTAPPQAQIPPYTPPVNHNESAKLAAEFAEEYDLPAADDDCPI